MKQSPQDLILFCAAHPDKDLRVFGVTKRKLANQKLKGLLRANGVNPLGFGIEQTITLPNRRNVVRHVSRKLYARVEQQAPVSLDNRNTLMGEAMGTLVVYDLDRTTAGNLMANARADLNQRLAAEAVAG